MATTTPTTRATSYQDHKDLFTEAGWDEVDHAGSLSYFESPTGDIYASIDNRRLDATRIEAVDENGVDWQLDIDWHTPLSVIEAIITAAEDAAAERYSR